MIERYSRQIQIPEVNIDGQNKLEKSKVLIVGAGGLGAPVSVYLTEAGIGSITLIDFDVVNISNLNRQFLYNENDIGKTKIEVATKYLKTLNKNIDIRGINEKITSENAESILKDYDLIIDCLDNFKTRYIINRYAWKLKTPVFHAGVSNFFGQITIIIPDSTPCLECVFPDVQDVISPVFGYLAGIVGAMLVSEVVKYLLNLKPLLVNKLLLYDSLNLQYQLFNLKKRPECKICNNQ